MNPVPMTTINPRKEYWPSRGSNQRPVFSSPSYGAWRLVVLGFNATLTLSQTSPGFYVSVEQAF